MPEVDADRNLGPGGSFARNPVAEGGLNKCASSSANGL